jgi:hypothetical protein
MPDWREATVQHVIDAFETPRLFDCNETVGLFNNANNGMIASWGCTDTARINFSEVVTHGTMNDSLFDVTQRGNQALEI